MQITGSLFRSLIYNELDPTFTKLSKFSKRNSLKINS